MRLVQHSSHFLSSDGMKPVVFFYSSLGLCIRLFLYRTYVSCLPKAQTIMRFRYAHALVKSRTSCVIETDVDYFFSWAINHVQLWTDISKRWRLVLKSGMKKEVTSLVLLLCSARYGSCIKQPILLQQKKICERFQFFFSFKICSCSWAVSRINIGWNGRLHKKMCTPQFWRNSTVSFFFAFLDYRYTNDP